MDTLRYTQLLSSKICHDLITPISAIQSGLELALDTDTQFDTTEIFKLIQQSSDTALRRLVFFRNALGAASATSFSSFEPVETLLQNYCEPLKIQLSLSTSWDHPELIDFPLLGRIILNLSLIICELAPHGAAYHISIMQTNHGLNVGINLEGAVFELRDGLRDALLGNLQENELSPQTIQGHITAQLITHMKSHLVIHESTRSVFSCALVPEAHSALYEGTLF